MCNENTKTFGYEANLEERLRTARQFLAGMLNADQDDRPYFSTNREKNGTLFACIGGMTIDLPHITGRALDILYNIEKALDEKTDPAVEEAYLRYFYSAMEERTAMPVYLNWTDGKWYMESHNLRQAAEALAQLLELRDSQKVRGYADRFITTLMNITDLKTGLLSDEAVERAYGGKAERRVFDASINHPRSLSTGRLCTPLLRLYQIMGDERALSLAKLYAASALEMFDEQGLPVLELSGDHVHSITSSLSSILDTALFTGNIAQVERVKQIYEQGFAAQDYMSSYGWIKEQIYLTEDTHRGEVNQVGDMIQVQLGLATYEEPAKWYAQAERFMRGGILPTQVSVLPDTVNYPHIPDDSRRNMAERIRGGWGFPSVNSFMVLEKGAVNTIDITQGAVQAICAFRTHCIRWREEQIWCNLLFSTENAYAKVESALPYRGEVRLTAKKAAPVRLRIPTNIRLESLCLTVNGAAAKYTEEDGYLCLPAVTEGTTIVVTFEPALQEEPELINGKIYTVSWIGEQVVDVLPQDGFGYLYGRFNQ